MDATEIVMAIGRSSAWVLPSGKLGLVAVPPAESGQQIERRQTQTLPRELVDAFGESAAAGLTLLASSDCQLGLEFDDRILARL